MARKQQIAERPKPKTVLRLTKEQSKDAVLNSLAAASSRDSCGHAIEEFIGWYCSEPRLAFQPNRGPAIPLFSGAEEPRARHNQRSLGRGAEACLRSF
jgi:hypothetical protein